MPRYQNEKKGFEDLSSFSSKNEYMRTKKAKGKRHRGVKITIVVVCSLLILLGGGAIFASQYLFGGLITTSITKDKDKLGIASDTADHDDITNIALFGLDSRDDSLGEGNRSDAIMILTLDQKHTKVKLTSILRDSRVYMGENYINTDSGYDRINHAYAFGGPELAIKALNLNFHLNILDYVVVDFTRMTAIVNAFGGIDLQITDGEVDEINANLGEIIRKDLGATDADYMPSGGGMLHLNGAQAVAFARIRNIGDDTARANRQQMVITALMEKAVTISKLEYPSLISQMASLCKTSLSLDKMLSFVPLALSGFQVEKIIVPDPLIEGEDGGSYENEAWMWNYDLNVAAKHINEFINEEPYMGKTAGTERSTDNGMGAPEGGYTVDGQKREQYYDENGNPMYDENGNPMYAD